MVYQFQIPEVFFLFIHENESDCYVYDDCTMIRGDGHLIEPPIYFPRVVGYWSFCLQSTLHINLVLKIEPIHQQCWLHSEVNKPEILLVPQRSSFVQPGSGRQRWTHIRRVLLLTLGQCVHLAALRDPTVGHSWHRRYNISADVRRYAWHLSESGEHCVVVLFKSLGFSQEFLFLFSFHFSDE